MLASSVQRYAGLKPLTPLRTGLRRGVKPVAPLLPRNARFCGIVDEQRSCRFHVCSRRSEQRRCWFHLGAKKFALRRCVIVKARKSSPCALKTPQIWCFCACWANFFALAGAPAGCTVLPVPSTPPVVGVLHDTKPSHSVSPACWTLMSCNSPHRVVVRSELEVVRRSKCGPPRRKVPNMGCCGRRGLRCGHIGACHSTQVGPRRHWVGTHSTWWACPRAWERALHRPT